MSDERISTDPYYPYGMSDAAMSALQRAVSETRAALVSTGGEITTLEAATVAAVFLKKMPYWLAETYPPEGLAEALMLIGLGRYRNSDSGGST